MNPDRRDIFRMLHESGCFVMPNPWDLGTARVLAQIGFPAIATTSSGLAWSMGRQDNNVTLDETVRHLHAVAQTVDVPVTTGVAGLSIEDSTYDDASPLFEFELAVDRIRAARHAIDESQTGVLLTARSEGFIVGRPDLAETIKRLTAYAEAGADCLYAPGLSSTQDVSAVVKAVAPKPVNVL